MKSVNISNFTIGEGKMTLIAGPCVIESLDLCREIAGNVKNVCNDLDINFIFKSSFDKANRTSNTSFRGEGLEKGLEVLSAIKSEYGVPVLTDVHESWQVKPAAEVVDVLQIPAFLCRQTDLLVAAAESGRAVNVKKGQFLAPWDMSNVVEKMVGAGCENLLLTERGTSFGYNALVVDMKSLPLMRAMGHPVIFDVTHSVQQPGGLGKTSGGQRDAIPHLMRAACAVGVDGLFIEVHPDPRNALSDAATMMDLSDLRGLLTRALAIHKISGVATC